MNSAHILALESRAGGIEVTGYRNINMFKCSNLFKL